MKEKRSICLFFQVHQPVRLRRYHFFDIGKSNDYFDDFTNRTTTQRVARNCYLPMNNMLIELAHKYGKDFQVSFAINGNTLDLLEVYAPEVIDSFRELADSGCAEFVAETYSHSLSSMVGEKEFTSQVKRHSAEITRLFGVTPKSFCNTAMIYSNEIGSVVSKLGYKTILTEGARHILGWKSPNYVYASSETPKLKILMRNSRLSDDISLRFSNRSWSEWPLTADKYVEWLKRDSESQDVVNLYMPYETFGERQSADTGIIEFMKQMIEDVIHSEELDFTTVSHAGAFHQPKAVVNIPHAISWMDEERDLSSWMGNELQNEAFECLNRLHGKVKKINDTDLNNTYLKLLGSDNLHYMSTKHIGNNILNPYDSPYEAFINYMNVISDMTERVKSMKMESSSIKRRKIEKNSQYEARDNG